MKQKRILVAVDGSHYSDRVIEETINYSRIFNAEVIFVYCHRKYPRLMKQPYRDHMISEIRDETAETVLPYLAMLKDAGVSYVERLLEIPAGITIAETAESEKCDMVIMGSRGLSNLQGLMIGSTTNRVLHLAKCPVLVVK